MRTLLEILEQELINEPNILAMSFTVISDHSPYGEGKRHLQNNNVESSATLCGKHLGFDYETERDIDGHFYNDCTIEFVLNMKGVCKMCLKSIKKTK